ncbi:putative glycosyltransferase EpsJ [Roseivivax jejudonensis]|uniref:Putative glycosyltransferase EpsJ n=1 Tax=Roseivivax jejudonensis TaxID=1529041 RepID=A0A1X6Y4P0_9RHOB|nr:glycosyltransferase family 2 protein [Roseivivax jejudonensis]SLN10154.1 putative glycosyltransferase EpsJ [Roseivivax jejudonensis]
MPKTSIIVPAYNVADTIAETLDSLRAQTFTDFEIIVVDDGSTDRTVAIARSLGDPRIRIVQQPNRGLAGARNSGIAAARGEYIGFCDADDLWRPAKLAAHVTHLDANPGVGLSFSGSEMIDERGRPTGLSQRPRLTGITAAHVFCRNPVGNGSAPVLRRAALDDLAWRPAGETHRDWWFDETFRQSEDIECWLRFALMTDWQIEGVPGLLTRYRIVAGGLSAATVRQFAAWERMVDKLSPCAPEFMARHAPAARAYQLRYLARRAVVSGNGPEALARIRAALSASFRPLWEEPAKTITTLAAAVALTACGPKPLTALRRLAARRA